MSYHLYRVSWKKFKGPHLVREQYSFHVTEYDIAAFIRKVMLKQTKRGVYHYGTQGPGNLHVVNGKLYEKVKKSKVGIWSRHP